MRAPKGLVAPRAGPERQLAVEAPNAEARPPRGHWQRVGRALRHHPGARIGAVLLSLVVLASLAAPYVAPYDPLRQDLLGALQPPTPRHLMGTDEFGRDIFSRILHGAAISLRVGLSATAIAVLVGVPVGLYAGYLRNWFDSVALRIVDAMLAFPDVLLALLILTALGPSLTSIIIGVGVSQIPSFVRLARSSTLVVRELEYMVAARVVGAGHARIVFHHVLPNVVGPIIILASLSVGSAILVGAGLSFLGLGAQPPTPEWGAMLISSRIYLREAPWVAVFPGSAIMVTVFAINMLGDGLRDALDVRVQES